MLRLYGSEIDRAISVMTTVFASGVSMPEITASCDLRADWEPSARTRSMLDFTAALVSGLPEWKLTPSRRVNVYVRPSSLAV